MDHISNDTKTKLTQIDNMPLQVTQEFCEYSFFLHGKFYRNQGKRMTAISPLQNCLFERLVGRKTNFFMAIYSCFGWYGSPHGMIT